MNSRAGLRLGLPGVYCLRVFVKALFYFCLEGVICMNLVIAKKPSVGAALAKALGAREKKKRYMMITTVGTNAPAWACVFNSVIFFIVLTPFRISVSLKRVRIFLPLRLYSDFLLLWVFRLLSFFQGLMCFLPE